MWLQSSGHFVVLRIAIGSLETESPVFTVFDDDATYDLSETDGIIPNISKTTPIDVIGGTMTVFAPGEEERLLQVLRQED